jgi:hypothetical protein
LLQIPLLLLLLLRLPQAQPSWLPGLMQLLQQQLLLLLGRLLLLLLGWVSWAVAVCAPLP